MDRVSMLASVPPATITSASPNRIIRAASPTECAPLAHAVTAAWFGPCVQNNFIMQPANQPPRLETCPPASTVSLCHPIASSHDRESVRESNLEAIADAHMPSSHVDKNAWDKEGA